MKKRSLFLSGLFAISLLVGGVLVGCNQADDNNDITDTTDSTDTSDTTDNADTSDTTDNADNTDSTDSTDTPDTTTATTYNIAFSETNEVVATLSATEATADTKIDITIVSVPDGYNITSITSDVSGLEIKAESETLYSFTMPESDVNLTINISEVTYQLTIDADEANGGYYTLTYNDESEDNFGEEVTDLSEISDGTSLRIIFNNSNSRAVIRSVEKSVIDISWTITNNANIFSFVMPNQNLTLTATWSFPSSTDYLYVKTIGAPSGISLSLEYDGNPPRNFNYNSDTDTYYYSFVSGANTTHTVYLKDSNSSFDDYAILFTCDLEGLPVTGPTISSSNVSVTFGVLYVTVSLTFTFNELS